MSMISSILIVVYCTFTECSVVQPTVILVEWQLCLAEGGGMWRSIPRGLQWWEAFTALVTDSNNLYILKEDIDSEKKRNSVVHNLPSREELSATFSICLRGLCRAVTWCSGGSVCTTSSSPEDENPGISTISSLAWLHEIQSNNQ